MEKKALAVMTEPFYILSYSIQLKTDANSIFTLLSPSVMKKQQKEIF